MTFRTWLKLAAVAAATTAATLAIAADHRDGPKATNDPAADITDVYSWIDGDNMVIVLNVSPTATIESKFSDKVQYWLHTTSGTSFGDKSVPLDIVCTFDAAQAISCWAGGEYVTGDASKEAGIASTSGRLKVFAGLRDDPFFFNLTGFKTVAKFVADNGESLMLDAAGCPKIDATTSTTIVTTLKQDGAGMPGKDDFAGKNVLSIVLSLDKKLMTEGGPIVSVYGATRAAN
jgi:hypothetical protein